MQRLYRTLLLAAAVLLLLASPALAGAKGDKARAKAKAKSKAEKDARKAEWAKDPKHCEVCLRVMTDLHGQVKALPNKKHRKDKVKIETMVEKYCSKKNKAIGARERKLCYYLLPIKREISTPLSFGADPTGVCKKLERKSAEVCAIKYPIGGAAGAAAGGEQEPIDYKKMRVKHLKQILTERGVKIKRVWSSKRDFVKACEESEHLAPEL